MRQVLSRYSLSRRIDVGPHPLRGFHCPGQDYHEVQMWEYYIHRRVKHPSKEDGPSDCKTIKIFMSTTLHCLRRVTIQRFLPRVITSDIKPSRRKRQLVISVLTWYRYNTRDDLPADQAEVHFRRTTFTEIYRWISSLHAHWNVS